MPALCPLRRERILKLEPQRARRNSKPDLIWERYGLRTPGGVKRQKPGVPVRMPLLRRGPFITGATSFGFAVRGREFATAVSQPTCRWQSPWRVIEALAAFLRCFICFSHKHLHLHSLISVPNPYRLFYSLCSVDASVVMRSFICFCTL